MIKALKKVIYQNRTQYQLKKNQELEFTVPAPNATKHCLNKLPYNLSLSTDLK